MGGLVTERQGIDDHQIMDMLHKRVASSLFQHIHEMIQHQAAKEDAKDAVQWLEQVAATVADGSESAANAWKRVRVRFPKRLHM